MAFHDTASGPLDMHGPYSQVFANDAARTGDSTVYTAAQSVQGGSTNPIRAYQSDTNSEYILDNHSPTSWVAIGGGGGGGEANTGANVGTGGANTAGSFRDKTGVTLNFRRVVGSASVTVTENGDDIELTAPGATGEANTGANVGGGVGNVFRDKTGVTLNFRTLVQGASMLLSQAADTITVALGTLSQTLNGGNQDVSALKTATYNSELDNGNSGAALTIALADAQKQRVTLTANTTLTVDAPVGPGNFILQVLQDATGSRSVTWAAGTGVGSIIWSGGTAPAIGSGGANTRHVIAFYFDGTDLLGQGSLNFS
jgi:hypothetical protein